MRRWLAFSILLLGVAGCGPEVSKTDLGHVVNELPKISDSDAPYPMPELGPPLPPNAVPRKHR
jgi:hypothetical protein